MRHADEADHRAGPGDAEGRLHRLARADALERRVDADAVGQLLDRLDGLVAALGDDVGRAELARERLAVGVAAQRDDPLGAEALGGEHAGEADRAVADDRDGLARLDSRADRRVVAGGHDVGEREQRAQHLVGVAGAGHATSVPSASGTRTASPWPPSPFIGKKPPFMHAVVMPCRQCGQVPSLKANGRDDEVALRDVRDLGADVLDDADELVADRAGRERRVAAVVPEVRAADAGEHDADDRVGRLAEAGSGRSPASIWWGS